ncbi:hypothetical protein BDV28DRAFT_72027 [Aspergillus coremiiformis]|uniref:GST N-terminal domain-containing protein n=1 Tax=Aspergillus coremiiformis TaxID=138285 RepID=A0A5N6YU04_9EURO|nr:hypothetical protein BDV28DRAFT_72027 [Aspergillus coremiiformis]
MESSRLIVLYDIASGPPVTCFAPNPWKVRYALNFKGVPYRTEWVELPEVTSRRKGLGVPPCRTFNDGSPYYTLPVVEDLATSNKVGDSFDIALYLDKTYPDAPRLLPSLSVGLHASFNAHVDALFTRFVILFFHGMPLNPETAEMSRATFAARAGTQSWEDLTVTGEARETTLEGFKAALAELAKTYSYTEGPFLEGNTVTYADFIVGGWLQFAKASLPEWEDLQKWHGGQWGTLHSALKKYAKVV